ncbi:unnamed protein product [Caenorhabditis angaria]|uniref:Uncharacterized protein n=1 Tax=Caenorhabditis angaria TaxID=860376 RepID=A0A9P1IXT9_9PELO|nr:unnamed protein product [Caenorhabditis angaria]
MLLRFCSVLVVFVLTALAQAALLSYQNEDEGGDVSSLNRLYLENELKHGEQLLRDILEKSSHAQLQDLERLSEPLRTKRCRWKLCGTGGRKFRYL